jgi:mediator of RNA polymerase II transcription subunit 12
LADVIGIVTSSCDSQIIGASADTVCRHFQAFKVIGAFDSLFERIVSSYTAIRGMRVPDKDLLLSLSALSQLAHVDAQLMQMLNYDLSRYDQRNSIAVCSPASDTMIDSSIRSDPEDGIERILSSGNNMDRQTMDRVFLKIVSYVEDRICQGGSPLENFSAWICRLQNFEERTFHNVLNSWLYAILASHEQNTLSTILPALVVSGCLTLSHFLEMIQACMRRLRLDNPVDSFRVAVIGLDQILPNDELGVLQHHYAYRFRTQQAVFSHKQNSGLLDLIKEAFELKETVPESQPAHALFGTLLNHRLLGVLKHFAITNLSSLDFLLEIPRQASGSKGITDITSVLDRIMDPLNDLSKSFLLSLMCFFNIRLTM